ncbi:hypothetical protein GCM10027048_10310 [Hymenobacter coalescens]
MPFIALVNGNPGKDFQELRLVKLYMDLFGTGLKEAREQIEFMLYKEGGYLIPVAEADISKAAHFVYQSREYGIICQLRSTSSD